MCGRVTRTNPGKDIARLFGLETTPELPFRYNVAPSQPLAVVRLDAKGKRQLSELTWGLIPAWSRDGKGWINARGDTVATKPAFRSAFLSRRCLVPVSGFYEWQRTDGRKQPYYFRAPDNQPISLAGLWDVWRDPDGNTAESCAIITTEANETMKPVHNRMPVILDARDYAAWLDPATEAGRLMGLLWPCGEDVLTGYPVGLYVNNPKNEGPRCIEPTA